MMIFFCDFLSSSDVLFQEVVECFSYFDYSVELISHGLFELLSFSEPDVADLTETLSHNGRKVGVEKETQLGQLDKQVAQLSELMISFTPSMPFHLLD